MRQPIRLAALFAGMFFGVAALAQSPAASVNPLIGSGNGGNTFPGAMLPFGMLAWSPENTRGKHNRTAAPGGYLYSATRIRGFSLTHLSGTGCAGASGDVPFIPITSAITAAHNDVAIVHQRPWISVIIHVLCPSAETSQKMPQFQL